MLLMSDSLRCIQILAPSPLCVMLCSVLQEQIFCPITDRFFHSFQSPPCLLVVAPHLQQDELYPWMDLISGLCSGCLHLVFCHSASWRGVDSESRQEHALPVGSALCLPQCRCSLMKCALGFRGTCALEFCHCHGATMGLSGYAGG